MRTLLAIIFCLSVACSHQRRDSNVANTDAGNHSVAVETPNDSVTDFLLLSCASDFQKSKPTPTKFNATYFGYKELPSNKKMFLLRGQFQPAEENQRKWIPFVTIKTSGYEQWIGAQSNGFTQDSTTVWDTSRDLSSLLASKVDSLSRR